MTCTETTRTSEIYRLPILVCMWTVAIEIHANLCLPELIYGNPYSSRLNTRVLWTQP